MSTKRRRPMQYSTTDLIDGLEKIDKALEEFGPDPEHDDDAAYNWCVEAVEALLRGERVQPR